MSSIWPETMGERPSLRSAIAATEVPAPTPPREDAPAPEDENEELPEPDGSSLSIADLAEEEPEPEPDAEPEPEPFTAFEPEPVPEPEPEEPAQPEQFRPRKRRGGRGGRTSDVLVAEAPAELDDLIELDDEPEPELSDDPAAERRGSVNTLAILALFIGVLASPLAALFGHLALNQLKVSGERGVIPAWISVVLGYLWLGFWIVFGVTYFATNG
ncbi:MAG: uncharacterized protein JWP32_824 [Schumannella sp.]|nr:uncharacterized protein [Schumannella sp.]